MGKDATELIYLLQDHNRLKYIITRNDEARTSLLRKDIDDYMDLKTHDHGYLKAKFNLINALNNFRHQDK